MLHLETAPFSGLIQAESHLLFLNDANFAADAGKLTLFYGKRRSVSGVETNMCLFISTLMAQRKTIAV